jgi:hypothetical protein
MLVDYFNSCTRACSLRIAVQIKIMGEPLLVGAVALGKVQDHILEEERV